MNKITTTAGLLAIGAVSLKAQVMAPSTGTQATTKPWTISAVLRGFYDDNYTTSHKSRGEPDSWGFEVAPSAALNLLRDQTAIGLSYTYSMRYYDDRDNNRADHSHIVGAKLSHAFTPRYKLDLSDSFVISQEPTILNPNEALTTIPLRSDGDNLRNVADGSFTAGVTENLDVVVGYQNTYWDYEQEDEDTDGIFTDIANSIAFWTPGDRAAYVANNTGNSRSTILDRIEHLARINLRQVILPNTVGVLGYHFEVVEYTSDDGRIVHFLGGDPRLGGNYRYSPAEARDSLSHYFFVGVDQRIVQNLNASLRVGAQYTEYDNFDLIDPLVRPEDDSSWSPYVDANATYTYLPGSYAQLGVRHQRIPTDVATVGIGSELNPDAEATSVYGSVNHRFLGSFVASLIGHYQHSEFDTITGDANDDYFTAGVNLAYEINRFLTAEVGYNYDRLSSDIEVRSFTRNRVYAGIRATY